MHRSQILSNVIFSQPRIIWAEGCTWEIYINWARKYIETLYKPTPCFALWIHSLSANVSGLKLSFSSSVSGLKSQWNHLWKEIFHIILCLYSANYFSLKTICQADIQNYIRTSLFLYYYCMTCHVVFISKLQISDCIIKMFLLYKYKTAYNFLTKWNT